ncbi:MAG: hypothetical protein QOJ86_3346 [Bradyrhizobium sp.]|nr:hypothetical protein [Bradyrhizobium sp.]
MMINRGYNPQIVPGGVCCLQGTTSVSSFLSLERRSLLWASP